MQTQTSTQFEQWVIENVFNDDPEYNRAGEIAQYGADTGVPGLIYTTDLRELFSEYAADILSILCEYANETGTDVGDLMTKREPFHEQATDPDSIAQYSVWAAVEILAYEEWGRQENA